MILIAIAILSSLTILNYFIGQKSIFYPPVVLCLVWTFDIILILAVGNFFYPLLPLTLGIFCCGCAAFSIGAALALTCPIKAAKQQLLPDSSSRFLTALVFTLVLAVPLVFRWLTYKGADFAPTWLMAARLLLLNQEEEAVAGSGLFVSIVSLSSAVAMICFIEGSRHMKRSLVAICTAFGLNLMTGGRSGATALIFALICLDWMKTCRVRWKLLLSMCLVFAIIFSTIAIYVQKGDARTNATFSENIKPVAEGFVLYAAGGPVAFDKVVRQPDIVSHNWHINRFFLKLFNALGARLEVPRLHASFVHIGPFSLDQNVYTFYFAYLDFGYLGMIFLLMILGFTITLIYRKAMGGDKVALLVYATLSSGLILSVFNESLFMNLNFLIRLLMLSWFLYILPAQWSRFCQFTRGVVDSHVHLHLGSRRAD